MRRVFFTLSPLLLAVAPLSVPAQITFGVCTSLDNAAALKEAGAGYIESSVAGLLVPHRSDDEFAANMALAEASPLPIYACNSFFPGDIKLTGPRRDHARALEYTETACRRAQMLGIEILVLGSSGSRNYPEGYDKQTAIDEFVELLERMGPIAAKYDVVVALEPLRKREANFMNRVAEGVEIVKRVGHRNIRCLADIYHMLQEGEGPEVLVKERRYIAHTHVAENEGRSVPGTHGEDLTPYYDALRRARYKGGMSIEASWRDFDEQVAPAIANLKENNANSQK
jgi:sugar phosphate isomerase/epimerase